VHTGLLLLVAVGVIVAPDSSGGALASTGGVVAVLAVVALALVAAWWRSDWSGLLARLRRDARGLREVLDSPARAARLFGGSAVVTLGYTVAFVGATLTMIPHTAGLGAALAYLAAVPVAVLLPVPGGVGVMDSLLVVGALLDGINLAPAIVSVLLFRLITFWLIVLPGYFCHRAVIRRLEPEMS
jgi:uncharacterized membrane protein YbhN (UPF0104 family)